MDELPIIKKDVNTKDIPVTSSRVAWHSIDEKQLEVRLSADFAVGLTEKRVAELQKRYGFNTLLYEERLTFIKKLLKQFKSPLVYVLLVAGILTTVLGDTLDATVIFIALSVNVLIGAIQEDRSSKAFHKLKSSEELLTPVIRGGKKKLIKSQDIVVGDLVILEAGINVPADIRILSANDLSANESPLTGEWVSVPKGSELIEEGKPLLEESNMLWAGTLITSGFGRGVVVETGKNTEIGKIAKSISGSDMVKTPIQVNIHKIAVFITYVILSAIALIFLLGILRGEEFVDMVLLSVAVAVSAVPEGLPAVVTVVLAIGMERILKERGLVRNILTAETLGSTTIIITDKTGTLTEAKMTQKGVITYSSLLDECKIDDMCDVNNSVLEMGVMSSDAFVEESTAEGDDIVVRGRPIEKAIVLAGLARGISEEVLSVKYPRLDFLSFNSENRFAVSLNRYKRNNRMYFSGAPEHLLMMSDRVFHDGEIKDLDDGTKELFIKAQNEASRSGMRVTAIAFRASKDTSIARGAHGMIEPSLAKNLVFAGMLIFGDPIRADVPESIKEAMGAGVRVIMATGDNPETARAVANDAGILIDRSRDVITGANIGTMSDEQLLDAMRKHSVFARVLPSEKLRMVNILRNSGEIVAMTGDGINDAPALKGADIGIVVGSGTDVAKEASDLVLLDNSFSIIVGAIREGRRIIDNLKRIISHLLSTSFSGIILIAGSLLVGGPLPILPAQILWHNIIEEGMLNFAFAFEPAERGVMKRRPSFHSAHNLLSRNIRKLILTIASITGVMVLLLFGILLRLGMSIEEVRTMMFVALSLDATFFIFSLKSFDKPIWKIELLSNKVLFVSVIASLSSLSITLLVGPIRDLLQLTKLSFSAVLILAFVALFNLATIETVKYFVFWKNKKSDTITA